jgi:hypothetical protein
MSPGGRGEQLKAYEIQVTYKTVEEITLERKENTAECKTLCIKISRPIAMLRVIASTVV